MPHNMPATWTEVVATQGGLAILGLAAESFVAHANREQEPEAGEPAGSVENAASALDARGSRPTMFELALVQRDRPPTRGRRGKHYIPRSGEFPR